MNAAADPAVAPDGPADPEEDLFSEYSINEILFALAEMKPNVLIYMPGMCRMFGKSVDAIESAVGRGELPRSAKLFNRRFWTAGQLNTFFAWRLLQAADEADNSLQDEADNAIRLPGRG